MSKKSKVDWSINGASPRPKWLHLEKDETDSLYHCPIQECTHYGFQSQCGCRKHMNTKHSWFSYFDIKPKLKVPNNSPVTTSEGELSNVAAKHAVRVLPSFSIFGQTGKVFTKWLTGSGGGCKKDRTAQQVVKRCFKFLKFCCDEEEQLTFEVMDFSLCSPNLLFKFIDHLQEECKLGHGGCLGYIDAIFELINFRKINGASDVVLQKCSPSKMMRLQWTQDLDIETLEAKGHWETMEELLEVVTFHLPCYENTVKMCRTSAGEVNPSDLTFAIKFVVMYLFIKVKGSGSMTYQYLRVHMVSAVKENGGFIDQKMFKTASKYGFDSLIMTDTSMQVLDSYITFVGRC